VEKSSGLSGCFFMLFLSVLAFQSTSAWAQSQRFRVAVSGIGPDGSELLSEAPASATPVWVDTVAKTFVEGWTEYDPSNCTDISTGNFSITTNPTHGQLFFDIETGTLANGDCPGVTFPFNVARYTWTDKQTVLQDPFALDWTTPDGMYNIVDSWTGELAKIKEGKGVWWVCGVSSGTLPNTGTLTLMNPPASATSFVWTVTAGGTNLVFSNSKGTITTTAPTASVKSLAASTAMKDVSLNVGVKKLTYFFDTTVRTPKKLKRRADLDHDYGVANSCSPTNPGTNGFLSQVGYEVDDQFSANTFKPDKTEAGVNEHLGAKTDHQTNNWTVPKAGGAGTSSGTFVDNLCFAGGWKPQPLPPQSPLTSNLVITIPQAWYAGSSTTPPPNKGCKVQTDTINFFIDHGRHTTIKSPPLRKNSMPQQPSAGGRAYPTPVLNVSSLAEQSTVIVKGRVLAVTENGSIRTASFRVDRVIKGKLEPQVIHVEFPENGNAPRTVLEPNEYALLFLKSGENGSYQFVESPVGKMPITSQNVPRGGSAQSTASNLEAELMASLTDIDSEVVRAALEQVGNLGRVESTQPIRDIATSGRPEFEGPAHIALIRLGDYSLLERAIQYVERPAQDAEERRVQLGVAEAIGDIDDVAAASALNTLLASPNLLLRRAAAKALRRAGDRSSVRFLIYALDDHDRDVQYHAVMALAGLTGASAENAPAREVFDQDQARYLGRWKSWWESSGKQHYGASQ
jgi:hypothetical protein